jgi:hypothetical protein
LNNILEVTDDLVNITTDLSLAQSVSIVDTLWCSNIESSNTIVLKGSSINLNNILEVTDDLVNITTDLSLAQSVSIVDTLWCSNIESANNIVINAPNVSIKGLDILDDTFNINASNVNIGGTLILNQDTNTFTINNDVKVFGNFECGTLTIKAFEERTKTLNIARSNLIDFFEAEQGITTPGALLTPNENVFIKPTYFLSDCFLSSNLKIDPVFKVTLQCHSNLVVYGEIHGDKNNSNGLLINDNATFNEPLHVKSNLYFDDTVYFNDTNSNGFWRIFTHTIEEKTCDLIFQSRNNIATAFTDEFDPNIINFTGQHRCTGVFPQKDLTELVGKIVVSTGKYSDLMNKSDIGINEAIPIVKMSSKEKDKKVFGVVSNKETNEHSREFHIGQIKFTMPKKIKNKKYMINSVGEGGIWIIDTNGYLENGDYICTSSIPGYGVKQDDNIHYNYTVAKITCDCDFNLSSKQYTCEEFVYKKKKYKKAFVGCIYKC